jgi:hypothetical protein
MKIAIGFFGITRSLKYTIDSIQENIFNVLKMNNIEYEIFIHTYHLTSYKNIRTRESMKDDSIDNEEYKLLNADYIEIDNQHEVKEQLNLLSYRTHKDPWSTNYNSVDNFILGQYSKLKLTNMIENRKQDYNYVVFMRPDCLYINKFPINFLDSVNDNTIAIPNFHLYGTYRFNDRFCIANMSTYKIYGEIFPKLLSMSKERPLHSETILGMVINSNNIKVLRIPFKFSRVRCNGVIADKF